MTFAIRSGIAGKGAGRTTTENGIDDHPPDEFIHVKEGANYGWPLADPNPGTPNGLDRFLFCGIKGCHCLRLSTGRLFGVFLFDGDFIDG
jgi:hypothetical protein